MSTPTALAISVFLLLANGFFVWAEFAVVASRRSRMEELVASGSRRASAALRAMNDINFVLAGAQLGITMASLGLGFVAEPAIGRLLEEPLHGLPHTLAKTIEVAVALGVVVAAHMVVGEMVPKNLAISEPERSALWLAFPFRLYTTAFGPVIWALNATANGVMRLLRMPAESDEPAHTPIELAAMIELSREEGLIDEFEQRLVSRILMLRDLDTRAAMIPRRDVAGVPITATPTEIGALVVETGHSRLPVYRESLDDVAGFVHVKDLLAVPAEDWDRPIPPHLVRDALVAPESRSLVHVLADMRATRTHVAVVVDEHGGVDGVITLEDVLEELVGDIRDEYDLREGTLWRTAPGRLLADGRLRPDELEEGCGLALPDGEYDTLGGYVMSALGRVPIPGDEIVHEAWRVRVRRMDGRRVALVELVEPEDRPAVTPNDDSATGPIFS